MALLGLPALCMGQAGNKWVQVIPDTGSINYVMNDVKADVNGNVYVTGDRTLNSFDIDCYMVKYDSLGNQLWSYNYSPPNTGRNYGVKILVDASGNTYVGGISQYATGNVIVLFKLDPSGNFLWEDTVKTQDPGGHYNNVMNDMAFDASGNIIMVGATQGYNVAGYPYVTVTKHTPNGTQLWINQTPVGYAYNYATGVVTDANDNIYISGWESGSTGSGRRFVARKYTPGGAMDWEDVYDTDPTVSDLDEALDIGIDNVGDIYVGGATQGSGGNYDYLVRKYNTGGALQWTTTVSSAPGVNDDRLVQMHVTPSGDVYLTGNHNSATDQNVMTAKLNASGAVMWTRLYDRGSYDVPFGITSHPSTGDVTIAVQTRRGSFYVDIATLKYTANGDTVYQKVQPSIAQGAPRAVQLKGNGDVYVTGTDGNRGITFRITDADAYLRQVVTGPGVYDFNSTSDTTAMTIDMQAGTGNGNMLVSFLANAVGNTSWCSGTNAPLDLSDFRWVINSDVNSMTAAILNIGLSLVSGILSSRYHGMDDPSKFSIYQRPLDGSGEFCKLTTTFANGIMSAPVTGFSEFFIGSETDTFNYNPLRVPTLTASHHLACYPNPTSGSTTLSFELPAAAQVNISVVDMMGRMIANPYNKPMKPGKHTLPLSLDNYSTGIYFIKLNDGHRTQTIKLAVTN